MTADEMKTVTDFEDTLVIGQRILVQWRSGGRTHTDHGAIRKINRMSIKVTLDDTRTVTVPRVDSIKAWSYENRVEPLGGYPLEASGMKLSLSGLQVFDAMSEETIAFTAKLLANGRLVAHVRNDGRGGCHSYAWITGGLRDAVLAFAATMPTAFDFEKLDQLVDDMVVSAGALSIA